MIRLRFLPLFLLMFFLAACGLAAPDEPVTAAQVEPSDDMAASEETVADQAEMEASDTDSLKAVMTEAQQAEPMEETKTDTVSQEIVPEMTGPSEAQMRILASLPNNGPAPELPQDTWLNSEPLTLADLRGKVVIVEFWTFG